MIEARVEIREGDILLLHTGWHRYAQFGAEPDEEKYIHLHPGAHPKHGGVAAREEDPRLGRGLHFHRPPHEPARSAAFLGKGMHGHCDRVRALCEEKFGADEMAELFPDSAYQLTHNALFPHDCMHIENLGGDIDADELQNRRVTLGCFPWKFKGGEAAFCRVVAFPDIEA